MSPTRTLSSCGISSTRSLRSTRPTRVTRASPAAAQRGTPSTSASMRIVRSFRQLKMRPARPTRSWVKNTGIPPSTKMANIASSQHRQRKQQQDDRGNDVERPLDQRTQRVLHKASAVDEPARLERVHRYFASHALVERREVGYRHAADPALEQVVSSAAPRPAVRGPRR